MAENKVPEKEKLLENLGKIAYTLDKAYLNCLERDYSVLPFAQYNEKRKIEYAPNIRALKVKRWVYDKEENISDCFKNVLSLFADGGESIALVINRTPTSSDIYFVVKNEGPDKNEESRNNIELLGNALRGNFNGSEIEILDTSKSKRVFNFDKAEAVSVLCNVPSEKSEDYICQGIEKLLNGIVPSNDDESYSVVILAESIAHENIRMILSGFEEYATAITPFTGYQFQAGISDTETKGEMESLSDSELISHSITKTHSINASVNAGVGIGPVNIGGSAGYGYSWGKTDTTGKAVTETKGVNNSISLGKSESMTYTYKSYMVSGLIEKLEAVIKRINESHSTGLWKCASYVFSKRASVSENAANFLQSITQGDASYIEPAFIQTWVKENSNNITTFGEIKEYIKYFTHPIFSNKVDKIMVTPTANVSTSELSDIFAFPRSSVQGLPVIECARFGREPHSLEELSLDLDIGCAYHMYQSDDKKRIKINKDNLTMHTFITGSTGSGKSNTVYNILEKLTQNNVKFMIVEPAKGEYKHTFGSRKGVKVYGTNPYKTELLRINPFKFPEGIHVLEHIDRLIEIFNVCWAMYAAMPAVLKDAVEQAYISSGWNLELSDNINGLIYPTFTDVLAELESVIKKSAYSEELKGNYTGALATRIKSLTNGINGLVFTSDEIDSKDLFDKNVIVDLSRVGSSETKALIMGILVIRLNEYRMSGGGMNLPLKHVTVLEEAHNILKRTSTEQNQESSNMLGKSVEMLANSIAEMRTYGEGFIIVDQSPGLMDMSVIRNTGTKIIQRLPDESDRMLAGKSVGMNDAQIIELAKLKTGVAAVSQSGWLEPVLCYIEEWKKPHNEKKWEDKPQEIKTAADTKAKAVKHILSKLTRQEGVESIDDLCDDIMKSNLSSRIKLSLIDFLKKDKRETIDDVSVIISNLFPVNKIKDECNMSSNIEEFNHTLMSSDRNTFNLLENESVRDIVLQCIVKESLSPEISQKWISYMREGHYV